MEEEDRKIIIEAINKAISAYEKHLEEKDYSTGLLPLKIEVQAIREGDYSFEEKIIVDKISEWKKTKKKN